MNYIREKARMVSERGARDRAAQDSAGFGPSGLRLIPATAWIVATVLYIGCATLVYLVLIPGDKEMRLWQNWQQALFAYGLMLIIFPWILLIGYVNADAKRRQMRYVMWTLLAIFVPNAIGIILYFLLRDPLPRPCPACGKSAGGTFSFCPYCGSGLALSCPAPPAASCQPPP